MAVSTREALAGVVVRVTEGVSIRAPVGARWSICFLIVANTARRNLAPCGRFTRWRVACIAVIVRGDICRNRQSRAAIERRGVLLGKTAMSNTSKVRERHANPNADNEVKEPDRIPRRHQREQHIQRL